jgi:hypothetical protein
MNKFDRILWRINGILFLIVLLFGILPLLWSLSESLGRRPTQAHGAAIVNQTQGTHEREFLHLGSPSRITGTSMLRVPLQSEVPSRASSFKSSGFESHNRNFLFIDHSDLSSWWLFEGFEQAIIREHDLRVEPAGNDKRVIGTIFEVVTTDTDGDHRITANDRVSVFFSGADGKKPIEIVSSSDRILSVDQVTNNEVLIT